MTGVRKAPAVKPPMIGVLHRDGFPVPSTGYDGWVCNLMWSDLEPKQGQYDFQSIDTAHAAAQGAKLPVKLRIFGGTQAPVWLQRRVGTFSYQHLGDSAVQCPRVWSFDYVVAYAKLHAALAAHVDPLPWVHDVTVFGLMAVYAEPFQFQGTRDIVAVIKAGYTDSLWRDGMMRCIQAHGVYRYTCCSLALTPVQLLNGKPDGGATAQFADALRAVLGGRGVLENNSLRAGMGRMGDDPYSQMFAVIAKRGRPITYQTATTARLMGTLDTVVRLAVALGGCAVEIPGDCSPDPAWSRLLRVNAP